MPRRAAICIAVLGLLLCGCQLKEVASGVNRKQASELLIALSEHGIAAEDSKSGTAQNERFSVSVSQKNYVAALRVARDLGVGATDDALLQEILGTKSFVPPSPEILAARNDFLRALEIERFLEVLPSVSSARVVVRSDKSAAPSVAVAVRLRNAEEGSNAAGEIKRALSRFVSNPEELQLILAKGSGSKSDARSEIPSGMINGFGLEMFSQPGMFQLSSLLLLSGLSALIVGLVLGSRLAARGMRKAPARREMFPELRTSDPTAPRLPAQRGDIRRDAA